jgi:hypothetical protein
MTTTPSKTFSSSILVYHPEVTQTKKQQIKDTTYVDGRKMVIGGSSTRNEKNWESTVFAVNDSKL